MTIRVEFDGGWYGDAAPSGAWAVLFPDKFIETSKGRVPLPHGQNLLFLVCAEVDGVICVAGQGHQDGQAWLWNGVEWRQVCPSYGTSPCAFYSVFLYVSQPGIQGNIQVFSARTFHRMEPITQALGARGIALVDGSGVHGQDAWYGQHGLAEYVDAGIPIGQGATGGCVAAGYGMLEPGNVQFIRAHRDGDAFAVAMWKPDEKKAVCTWLLLSDFAALPPVVVVDPPPPPPPPQPPPEKPMYRSESDILPYMKRRWAELGIPESVKAVSNQFHIHDNDEMKRLREGNAAERAKQKKAYEAFRNVQIPAFFRIVGELYASGKKDVGLGKKTGGNNWEGKAVDIIVLKPIDSAGTVVSGQVRQYDALSSAGYPESKPMWDQLPSFNPERTWVEPPLFGTPDPPPPPPPPDGDSLEKLRAQVEAMNQAILYNFDAMSIRLDKLTQRVEALEGPRKVALRTDNGHYFVAEAGGGGAVNANRMSVGPWETVTIEPL